MTRPFLNRAEAADLVQSKGLPCSKLTLQKMATVGGGPDFQKFGNRVVYTVEALDRWIESRLSAPKSSTSQVV